MYVCVCVCVCVCVFVCVCLSVCLSVFVCIQGLLLLTNNGALKRFLELPANAIAREYHVKLHAPPTNPITPAALDSLAEGVTIEGIQYGPMKASILVLVLLIVLMPSRT